MLNLLNRNKHYFYFLLILILALVLRLYNINWDQNHHFHPDERAIVMFTIPLSFPTTLSEFLSIQSSWNPHFFAYGSFPLYFLKIAGNIAALINPIFTSYDVINLIGRVFSAFFDTGTIIILFFLGKKLFNTKVALLASFFYTVSVLPIQLSHFFAVDTFLTFFILLTQYLLLRFYERPTLTKALLVGVSFGLSLATKISAVVLVISIGSAIAFDFLLVFVKNPLRLQIWFPHLPKFLKNLFVSGVIITFITTMTFIIVEPYSLIDFKTFLSHNQQQSQMTRDAFTFPYTLQYVGKIDYWYEIKNIFLWGQGPILAMLSFLGTLYFTFTTFKKEKKDQWAKEIILMTFFWAYFFVVGHFAIGFMRYLLPLYPLLCLFAAAFFWRILTLIPQQFRILLTIIYLLLTLIWPVSFMHIYHFPQTRITASDWIHKNIADNSTLAVEHWDDRLPLTDSERYRFVEMTLYEQPDDNRKWAILNQKLGQTDYIILASNRLYIPLPKLGDCLKYKLCYPKVAEYYKKLFEGTLGFQKVAEFTSFPTIPLLNIPIDDQAADESFTVYDHPKVMIFRNVSKLSQ